MPGTIDPAAGVLVRHASGSIGTDPAVYFETFAPPVPTGKPAVVMLHGGAHSGGCWAATADGRPGWAHDFVGSGYTAVTPDWPGIGRSGYIPVDEISAATVCAGLHGLVEQIAGPIVLLTHSMGGALGWIVAEQVRDRLAALVAIAPGPPGNLQPQPDVLSTSDTALTIRTPHRTLDVPRSGFVANGAEFVDAKLIGDGSRFPPGSRDGYAASLLALPSALLRQRLNIAGTQARVNDPGCFRGLPILLVTGTNDLEHRVEDDKPTADWLGENGAAAEFVWLGDRAIEGNGHMLMLEDNSAEIARLVCHWLDQTIG